MFEKAVSDLFSALGAKTIVTSKSGDYGIDIIVEYEEKKYAVQCKHHSNPVGPAPLRELRGVVEGEFDKGIFVSLNGYTKQAKSENYSAHRKLILLDKNSLIRMAETNNMELFLK